MNETLRRHHTWDDSVGNCAPEDLSRGLYFTSWIIIRCHYKACLLIVVLVFVQDAIEVRELPGEDIPSQ